MAALDMLADVIRSKNASPFEVTIDIFFSNWITYKKVKDSNVLSPEFVSKLYGLPGKQVMGIYFVDQALGIKITLEKNYSSDHFLSRDCYGAQQHLPLLSVEIPGL